MKLYIYHGRLDPAGEPTRVDGTPVDDWGFDGPTLERCTGFHSTYFDQGHFNVFFENTEARDAAQAKTGWQIWDELGLTVEVESGCLRLFNRERNRHEYFGDWGMK